MQEATTESFETFYAIVRAAYCPGTRSQGKQIMANIFAYYLGRPKHTCKRKLRLRPKGKDTREDCWVETKDGPYQILKVLSSAGQPDKYECRRVRTAPFNPKVAKELPWDLVWVRRYRGVEDETVVINKSDIITKALVIDERYIVSMPKQAMFG